MIRPRHVASAAALVGVAVLPLVMKTGKVDIVVTALCFAVAALGLEVLVGRTGQLSLAQGALVGVGCWTTIGVGGRGAPWPLAVLAGVAATAAVATVLGLPALRIRGLQVAIATLAFQSFGIALVNNNPGLKSGDQLLERPGFLGQSTTRLYYLAVAVVLLVMLLVRRLRLTRLGRSLLAVRDVEARSEAFGIVAGRTKLAAYALSGAITGVGGALFALQQQSVQQPESFDLLTSLTLVAVVVVGGAQSPVGVVVASLLLLAVPKLVPPGFELPGPLAHLGPTAQVLSIAFAVLLVVSVVIQPAGLGGVLRDLEERLEQLLGLAPERPSPRPAEASPDAAAHAVDLRRVPRRLPDRLPTSALLVARDVGVQYGGVRALQGLDLEVRRGEVVGLIGANGAGKSTFFNAVSGLAPVTGSLTYRGQELVGAPPSSRSRRGIARTFQDMGLIRAETVRDNVLMAQTWLASYPAPAGLLGVLGSVGSERELRRRADLALELFGLSHLRDERLGDLPYGTMRITEIAAAVAAGPELLLLDEATAGLTPLEAHALGDRFLALRDELDLTLVVIEHHVPLIARVCDYCYCLESGQLIAEGAPDEVTAQPRVVESFLGRGALVSS